MLALNNIYFTLLFCVILLLAPTKVKCQDTLTLDKVIQIAVSSNVALKQAENAEMITQINLDETKNSFFPRANLRTSSYTNLGRNIDPYTNDFINTQIFTQSASLSIDVPLFRGGLKLKEYRQRHSELELSRKNSTRDREGLTLNAVNYYLSALQARDLVKLHSKRVELTMAQLLVEKKMQSSGYRTVVDTSIASVQVNKARQVLANSINEYKKSIQALCFLMNVDLNTEYRLDAPELYSSTISNESQNYLNVIETAKKNSTSIEIENLRIVIAKRNIEMAKAQYWPQISFNAGLYSGYSSLGERLILKNKETFKVKAPFLFQLNENLGQTFGVTMAFPLANNGISNSIKKARLNYQNAKMNAEKVANDFTFKISQLLLDLDVARNRVKLSKETYKSSVVSFEAIKKRYRLNLVNSLEFAQAQTLFFEAENDLIQSDYELLFQTRILNFYTGDMFDPK